MGILRSKFPALYALVITILSVLVVSTAPFVPGSAGKGLSLIQICTASGVQLINLEDPAGEAPAHKGPSSEHCPLCLLRTFAFMPMDISAWIILPRQNLIRTEITPESQTGPRQTGYQPQNSRAPPSFS